jgi:hypothetical protein
VRSLEDKIRELEKKLALATETSHAATTDQTYSQYGMQYMASAPEDIMVDQGPMDTLALPDFDMNSHLQEPRAFTESSLSISFVEELKLLSLEATAERHLGSSSGLSFAKLTQSILRRLSPDKADFVFDIDSERDIQVQPGTTSPSDSRDGFNLLRMEDSVSCFPVLFGTFSMSNISEPDDVLDRLSLPSKSDINRLVEFYFAHSHTLYPFIHRSEFISVLNRITVDQQDPLGQSPLWLFRIWMVLAIGSTAYSSVTLHEESESMLYYNKAMVYFEAALEYGDMVCIELPSRNMAY